jgi:CHAT domain-containing protein
MNYFYAGLKDGKSPEEALRAAKLEMCRQRSLPYYWAAFQLYSH